MAEVLDCPRGTVKSRFSRALDRLRGRLPESFVAEMTGSQRRGRDERRRAARVLEAALRSTAVAVDVPATPALAAAVRSRLVGAAAEPVVGRAPRRRLVPGLAFAGACLSPSLGVIMFSPAAREAVADFLGVDGIRIGFGDADETPSTSISTSANRSRRPRLSSWWTSRCGRSSIPTWGSPMVLLLGHLSAARSPPCTRRARTCPRSATPASGCSSPSSAARPTRLLQEALRIRGRRRVH